MFATIISQGALKLPTFTLPTNYLFKYFRDFFENLKEIRANIEECGSISLIRDNSHFLIRGNPRSFIRVN